MAVNFETLSDESKYAKAIRELHSYAPTLAETIIDTFAKADGSEDPDLGDAYLNRAIDIIYGGFLVADALKDDTMSKLLLDVHNGLVWAEVI